VCIEYIVYVMCKEIIAWANHRLIRNDVNHKSEEKRTFDVTFIRAGASYISSWFT